MEKVRRGFVKASTVGNAAASLFLGGVMALIVAEIVGRHFFNHPIQGSTELIALAMGVLATIGFSFALEQDRHIKATMMIDRLPQSARSYLFSAAYLACFIVVAILSWELAVSAWRSVAMDERMSGAIPFPIYPVKIVMAFAVILLCAGYLIRFIEGLGKRREDS